MEGCQGGKVEKTIRTLSITINNLDTEARRHQLVQMLSDTEGVIDVETIMDKGQVYIDFMGDRTNEASLKQQLMDSGYTII
ncbi:MAG: hypothetical protein ACOYEJ_03260 [Mahellales bacterium]|jgi:hypothetical protein